ncbi:tryptophan transporter [Clostridium saccharoperbutylacetonicum]|uniref:tryptophan transporter n=1 Tax=Clostridium saccharoperbutylacetonicum TaxID=36745 RepID=UPI0039E9D7C5
MNTRKMVTNAILIAVGAILHQLTPLLGVPMQPDLSLAMLFIIIVYNKDYKTTLVCGIIVGVFAALTTKTPGGQFPNILDKLITSNIVYLMLIPLRERFNKLTQISILLPIGTLISGTVFLSLLMVFGGLPMSQFGTLFITVVVTTAILNVIIGVALFKIVDRTVGVTGAYAIK